MIEYELKVEGVCIVSIELECRLPRSISKLLDGDGVNESGFSLLSRFPVENGNSKLREELAVLGLEKRKENCISIFGCV